MGTPKQKGDCHRDKTQKNEFCLLYKRKKKLLFFFSSSVYINKNGQDEGSQLFKEAKREDFNQYQEEILNPKDQIQDYYFNHTINSNYVPIYGFDYVNDTNYTPSGDVMINNFVPIYDIMLNKKIEVYPCKLFSEPTKSSKSVISPKLKKKS